MLQLYKNIKSRRTELHLTQSELADKMGYADKSMIAKIEKGLVDLPQSKILAFAKALETTPSCLMGWTPAEEAAKAMEDLAEAGIRASKGVKINVLGRVAAGIPIDAIEDIIDTEEITEELAKTGEFFGLQIHGDSMTPNICDGDIVIVRQQNDAESGDIVIATVNGDEATCKRLRKYKDGIELVSINPSYKPFEFSNEEIIKKPVKILGKVVELRRKF